MSTKKDENTDLFKQALTELSDIKNNVREKIKADILKENEKKIDSIVEKLMENDEEETTDTIDVDSTEDKPSEDTTPDTEEVTTDSETTPDTDSSDDSDNFNLSVIDNILADIDPAKMIADLGKDVDTIEVETEVTYDDGKGEKDSEDKEIDENKLMEFYNKTKTNNEPKMENEKEIKDQNFDTTNDAELSDEQICEILKEMANELDAEHGDVDSTDTTSTEGDEDITDEQIAEILKEMEVELEIKDDSTEATGESEEEIEEGKSIGHKNMHSTNQKPQDLKDRLQGYRDTIRPYTVNEDIQKEFEQLKSKAIDLINENKQLKDINTEAIKRLDNIKKKLYETTMNSHKTSFVNQLFLEHSLSKIQKVQVIKEFIEVDTIEKSKETFNKLNENFKNKEVISEAIENKITKTVVTSGASTLNETTLTESYSPQVMKMRSLMK